MKCLTIHQPYAHLILTPQSELPSGVEQKRVENRTWPTKHRGPLLIHAWVSRKWLETFPQIDEAEVTFGAILGVVDLVDVVDLEDADHWSKYPWLLGHQHTEGPFCWILSNPRRFETPIPYRGLQGLFNVDDGIVEEAVRNAK